MTKFNFTADELNKILGWGTDEEKHSTRWNRLRNKFAVDMDEDLFNEVYRAFYEGSTGIISNPTKPISNNETKAINLVLNLIDQSDFPISFSDVFFSDEYFKTARGRIDRDRAQKIVDLLEKTHKVEGLRVIRIMTQGTCHIKLYEIR